MPRLLTGFATVYVSPIESPFTFFEIEREIFISNAIEPTKMVLSLIPEVLDPVNVIVMFNKGHRMINTNTTKAGDIQGIVAGQGIGLDNSRAQSFG